MNGILHVLRVGCPWHDMHERYRKWNSIYIRFGRWAEQGVWDAFLETLIKMGLTDDWQHMIDSSSATRRLRTLKGDSQGGIWSITQGFTTKIHSRADVRDVFTGKLQPPLVQKPGAVQHHHRSSQI
ncbi:transposase [Rhizobium lusitanum]|nr:transposase [Rhizobium lusitanum]